MPYASKSLANIKMVKSINILQKEKKKIEALVTMPD